MKTLFWNIVESMNAKSVPCEGIQTLKDLNNLGIAEDNIMKRCLVYIREFFLTFISIVPNKTFKLKCIGQHFAYRAFISKA